MSELVRANRVSVQKAEQGEGFVAVFHRTHKVVATIESQETGWLANDKLNSTANRELFRAYVCDNANSYGVDFDPSDRRTEANQFPAKYESDVMLMDWACKLIEGDIHEWAEKCGVSVVGIVAEEVTPVTMTAKGKEVKHRYNNGNWAWATISIVTTVKDESGNEAYVTVKVELVSGQLKKPTKIGEAKFSNAGFRTEIEAQLPKAEEVTEEGNENDEKESA